MLIKMAKTTFQKKLTPADKKILDEHHIAYYPKKYTVVFHNRK